jgi:hypothetical protein
MAVTVDVGDPVVYQLAFGQIYPAEVTVDGGQDPPILTVKFGDQVVAGVTFDANLQAPNRWCRYTDPGRPRTLPEPDLVIASAVFMTQADADARYLTQADAATDYAAADHTHA